MRIYGHWSVLFIGEHQLMEALPQRQMEALPQRLRLRDSLLLLGQGGLHVMFVTPKGLENNNWEQQNREALNIAWAHYKSEGGPVVETNASPFVTR